MNYEEYLRMKLMDSENKTSRDDLIDLLQIENIQLKKENKRLRGAIKMCDIAIREHLLNIKGEIENEKHI